MNINWLKARDKPKIEKKEKAQKKNLFFHIDLQS